MHSLTNKLKGMQVKVEKVCDGPTLEAYKKFGFLPCLSTKIFAKLLSSVINFHVNHAMMYGLCVLQDGFEFCLSVSFTGCAALSFSFLCLNRPLSPRTEPLVIGKPINALLPKFLSDIGLHTTHMGLLR